MQRWSVKGRWVRARAWALILFATMAGSAFAACTPPDGSGNWVLDSVRAVNIRTFADVERTPGTWSGPKSPKYNDGNSYATLTLRYTETSRWEWAGAILSFLSGKTSGSSETKLSVAVRTPPRTTAALVVRSRGSTEYVRFDTRCYWRHRIVGYQQSTPHSSGHLARKEHRYQEWAVRLY